MRGKLFRSWGRRWPQPSAWKHPPAFLWSLVVLLSCDEAHRKRGGRGQIAEDTEATPRSGVFSPRAQETTKPDTWRWRWGGTGRSSFQQALGGGWRGWRRLEQKQQEAAQEAAGGGLNWSGDVGCRQVVR